ncbi:MAG: hypothetical protein U0X40_00180 [Ferruginibacter sp.]
MILSSGLLTLAGCDTVYKELQRTNGPAAALDRFRPAFSVALYSTSVEVVGNHLSGLLLIKKMPDSTLRMVFSNEMGFKFFDFEFAPDGNFKVYSIIKKMNRKSVIKTLRKDFELVLMQRLDPSQLTVRQDTAGNRYHIFPQTRGYNCYITNAGGNELIRAERASPSAPIAQYYMGNYVNGIPDTIGITHLNFDFTIALKRLEQQ